VAKPAVQYEPKHDRLQSVRRALSMLEALATRPTGATPKELSQDLGLHLSTSYRLLKTLVAGGYAVHSTSDGLFRLGPRVAYLHYHYLAANQPPAAVVPFVHALQLATGETSMLTQIEGDDIVATQIVKGSRPASFPPGYVGLAVPAHTTAAGRSLLAWLTPAQIECYVDRQTDRSTSPFPLTSPSSLRAELGRIRQIGYAVDRCEGHPNVGCIAVPVQSATDVVGSVSVVAPCARFRQEEANLTTVILAVARAISDLLTETVEQCGPTDIAFLEPEAANHAAVEAALATITEAMSRVG
jgi:IclR family acetate operon transcriptional repressor